MAELQRRFNALAEQRKAASENPASLLTKELTLSSSLSASRTASSFQPQDRQEMEAEIVRLDEQIIELRKRHDVLHHNNGRKRKEIDGLADKLKEVVMATMGGDDRRQKQLALMEEQLIGQAVRYDTEHFIVNGPLTQNPISDTKPQFLM